MTVPSRRRLLCLWGFMGAGKSSIGALLADQTGARLIDLDQRIEQRAGMTIAEVFRDQGEQAFRNLEAETLREVLDTAAGRCVIALGGGALIDERLRRYAKDHALVVTLEVSLATVLERTKGDDTRPLLKRTDKVQALLKSRAHAYRDVHETVVTDERTMEEICAQLRDVWAY